MIANWNMLTSMAVFIFIIGEFVNFVTPYNSIMTYIVRPKKIVLHPNITGKIILDHYKYNEYINGNISFNFIEHPNKVVVIFNRCDPEGINCEYFQTWSLTNICSKLKEKNQVWSSYVHSFHPPLECPIKVHYQLKNGTIELDPFVRWYSDVKQYQWKIIIKYFSNNLFLGSMSADMSIIGYRKRIS